MKKGLYEVMDVVFRDYVTKRPVFFFDTLKMSTLNVTGEQTEATGGKGNATLYVADHSRKATIDITDALISMTSLAMLAGKTAATKGSRILGHQEPLKLTIAPTGGQAPNAGGVITFTNVDTNRNGKSGTATLVVDNRVRIPITFDDQMNTKAALATFMVTEINNNSQKPGDPFIVTAKVGAGGETVEVRVKNIGGQYGAHKATMTVAVETGTNIGITFGTTNLTGGQADTLPTQTTVELKYKPVEGSVYIIYRDTEEVVPVPDTTGKTLTIKDIRGLKGTIVYQYLAKETKYITISAETFPGYFEIEGSTMEVDTCSGEMREFIVLMRRAKLGANFTIELNAESNPAEFAFNVTAMRDCDNTDLVEFIEVIAAE